ncbi:MGMT family protein [Agrococcus jejuensis]|uniref:MGMT family protein n=1 Tax=Agrococcus jejuensis TaxID=399736 RepID=UPI00119FF353|nr:MGMT family protein [Agrococcus jejuensis]
MTDEPDHDAFAEAVHELVASIPPGRVMAYGEVAAVLGSRAARRVGRIMATDSEGLPWWRVIRSSGLPPAGLHDRALPHYEAEGTPLAGTSPGTDAPFRIQRRARWMPD